MGKEKGALEAPALSSLRSAQWKMKRHSAVVARMPLCIARTPFLLSVEGYGQVRVRRQDKLSPMIRLNEGASLAREHIVLDGGKVAPEFCGKG